MPVIKFKMEFCVLDMGKCASVEYNGAKHKKCVITSGYMLIILHTAL